MRGLCQWVAESGAVSAAHASELLAVAGSPGIADFAATYSGSLGILPAGLSGCVLPKTALAGPEVLVKGVRKLLPTKLLEIRLAILRGTMSVHDAWGRMRAAALRASDNVNSPPTPAGVLHAGAGVGGSVEGCPPPSTPRRRAVRRRLVFDPCARTDTTAVAGGTNGVPLPATFGGTEQAGGVAEGHPPDQVCGVVHEH